LILNGIEFEFFAAEALEAIFSQALRAEG